MHIERQAQMVILHFAFVILHFSEPSAGVEPAPPRWKRGTLPDYVMKAQSAGQESNLRPSASDADAHFH
jgi:hypothetical protein